MEINPTQLSSVKPLRATTVDSASKGDQGLERAQELKQAYGDFIGKTFFGQLMKSMRSSVGKPAYFDGGRAEEVFRGQLDQTLADHMTVASSDRIADPMFRHQFPEQAELLAAAEEQNKSDLTDLSALRRR
ncbi:rod-binding protein [Adhaeretor mobilis]|uniref:Rod binding protein n=1 Tax=Adhaeretor mobilis TaxID=1930276 RepID=A0A517MTW1_9BACT|nr:rod-binding protein [Adhaeretor mobilis]QDS98319.1 Rod binding protein [Adhaeretor mobilis]